MTSDQNTILISVLVVIGLVALVFFGLASGLRLLFGHPSSPAHPPPPPPVKVATIRETTTATLGGALAVIMLVVTNVGSFAVFFVSPATILQQAIALLVWIGFNVLFGIGAILGRKRTYEVYQAAPIIGKIDEKPTG